MSYLEELLPEFRKGAKIRLSSWSKDKFIVMRDKDIVTNDNYDYPLSMSETLNNQWEFNQEPIDWDYIIKNKCLCWFWDDNDTDGVMAILVSVYKDSPYRYYCRDLAGCGSSRKHFRPVRRDEVTFYEDKRDGNN